MYEFKSFLNHAAGAIAVLALFSTGASANLITNAGFESGDTGFSSAYTGGIYIFGESTYSVVSDPNLAHGGAASYGDHTSGSGLMMAVNGATTLGTVIWSQTVSVAAGTLYDFATYISSWYDQNPADLTFAVNGTNIGGLNAPSTTGIWELAFATWNSGANTSALIEIRNLNTVASGNDFALDDLYFGEAMFSVEVPEPAIAAIFGLGLLGLGLARRRRALPNA